MLLLIPILLLGLVAFPVIDLDNEFDLILPSEIPTDELQEDENIDAANELILSKLSKASESRNLIDRSVRIGQNEYLIIKMLGEGAEGVAYKAKDYNNTIVVIKGVISDRDSYNAEVFSLKRLDRLLDYDDKYMALVEPFYAGKSFDEEMDEYVKKNVGPNELPSNHIPPHMKEKYFKILWDFRNRTQMVHGDFRPYNVIQGHVFDFGRTELLSRNVKKRKRQIIRDDRHAEKEWEWYWCWTDWARIEDNPLIPNALKRANEIWDLYVDRYDEVRKAKKYRAAWFTVLTQILETKNTKLKFPRSGQFTDD
jgi:hypothetical protein